MNDMAEYDALLSVLRVAQWRYDPARNELTWQQSFSDVPGRSRPHSTETMETVLERYSPDDRTRLLKHFETALKEGTVGPTKFAVFSRSGEPTFIESAGIRFEGESGYPIVRGVFRNCAGNVDAEMSLRDFTGLLGRMTAVSESAIMMIDSHGGVRSVNSEFCKVFKLPADHGLVGRNIRNIPNRLGKALIGTLISLLETGSQDVHTKKRFILPDGSELMLGYRAFRIGSGNRSRGLVFKADVEHDSGVNMGTLFNHLPTPMVAINLADRQIVASNAMARRYLGLRKEHNQAEDITARILPLADLRSMLETISSLGIENGHICQVKSLLGESQTYRLRALPYNDNDRRLMVLEFHPSKKKKSIGNAEPAANRKGLLKRMAEHLDF